MNYAIVIPACDTTPRCKEYMETLLSSLRWGGYTCPVVICYDNCSPEFISFCEKEYNNVVSLPYNGPSNLNFCANANRGLRYAYKELHVGAFCVNMDVCLPHRLHLEKIINKGLSSPIGKHIPGTAVGKFFDLNQINDPACPCNKNAPQVAGVPTKRFAAFCMWISPEAFEKIGFLDQFTFKASFEDDDMLSRACLAGLPVEQYSVLVHHELDPAERAIKISTTGSYNVMDLGAHMLKFMKKYGIPQGTPHDQFVDWILNNKTWNEGFRVELP